MNASGVGSVGSVGTDSGTVEVFFFANDSHQEEAMWWWSDVEHASQFVSIVLDLFFYCFFTAITISIIALYAAKLVTCMCDRRRGALL